MADFDYDTLDVGLINAQDYNFLWNYYNVELYLDMPFNIPAGGVIDNQLWVDLRNRVEAAAIEQGRTVTLPSLSDLQEGTVIRKLPWGMVSPPPPMEVSSSAPWYVNARSGKVETYLVENSAVVLTLPNVFVPNNATLRIESISRFNTPGVNGVKPNMVAGNTIGLLHGDSHPHTIYWHTTSFSIRRNGVEIYKQEEKQAGGKKGGPGYNRGINDVNIIDNPGKGRHTYEIFVFVQSTGNGVRGKEGAIGSWAAADYSTLKATLIRP